MTEIHSGERGRHGRWIAAIWAGGLLFDGSQTVLFMHAVGRERWLLIFVFEVASWLPWVLATPLIIRLARTRRSFAKAAGAHLAAFLVISLVAETWFAAIQMFFNPWDYPQ